MQTAFGHALALVALCSCSFVFTRRPESPSCSPSRAAPIADTAIAAPLTAAAALALIFAASAGAHANNDNDAGAFETLWLGAALVTAVPAGAMWASAAYGYDNAASCRALRDQLTPPASSFSRPGDAPRP
jgi:hypothetical protein